ncbi:MAG: ABC transporter permease [Planctomycetes bacterium]|nr:ABC transporter permease [Planctomycetota bacterium]
MKSAAKTTWRRRLPRWFLGLMAIAALFAPILANDVPLLARSGGTWSFPAFATWFGPPPTAPTDFGWKDWWARLPEGGDDFALMPPWAYGPTETNLEKVLAGPSLAHPFGNDDTGRDVLARLLHGASTALGVGVAAVVLGAFLGVALGALAGLRRGFADFCVLRAIEVSMCFPTLLLLITAAAFFGPSVPGMVVLMAATYWTSFARIVRGELLSLREREFVLAARGLGVQGWRLLRGHLLPQVRGQIAITAAFCIANAIIVESTLSFLDVGPTSSSWGAVLEQGKSNAHLGAWHLWFFPAGLIVATVTCCHALADQVRARRLG